MTWVVHDNPAEPVCTEVLAAAFAREPTVLKICGSVPRRRTAWFSALLRTHATVPGRHLLATRDERPRGVAVATAPGGRPALGAQLSWTWRTVRGCGPRPLVGTLTYLRRAEAWKPADAWTLEFVGVLPTARGEGLARRLCERVQADYPGAPAFLTTADPRNVDLYERWGFAVSGRAELLGLTVVAMTRRPRTGERSAWRPSDDH